MSSRTLADQLKGLKLEPIKQAPVRQTQRPTTVAPARQIQTVTGDESMEQLLEKLKASQARLAALKGDDEEKVVAVKVVSECLSCCESLGKDAFFCTECEARMSVTWRNEQ